MILSFESELSKIHLWRDGVLGRPLIWAILRDKTLVVVT